ncbi:MAG: hypothetical protein ACP5OX_00755 [Minisyncoccia bacterium]
MTKQILLFGGGMILGFILFFLFSLTTPSFKQEKAQINTSSECGLVTTFKYCGSNNFLCEVSCNICGCDKPNCTPITNCTP